MPSSVYVQGQEIKLTKRNHINEGGEADIYLVGGKVLKVFKDPTHQDFQGNPLAAQAAAERIAFHQTKLRAFPKGLPSKVVVPEELATDKTGQKIQGYTMRYLRGGEVLFHYGERAFRQTGVSEETVLEVLMDLHPTVEALHQRGVVIGDFNDLNVLSLGKEAFLIDADSYQFGNFPCRLWTARFVDPQICDSKQTSLVLQSIYSADCDWYAYSVMVMQSLLFVDPYGGVYKPKDPKKRIPHTQRPLRRVTIFDPEVIYPKPARPYGVLPDDLLQFFHLTFEKDQRGIFPLGLLQNLRWTTCTNCGTLHARSACPICQTVGPAKKRAVTTIKGKVIATRVFVTKGVILVATFQGKMRYLYHEGDKYLREDGTEVASGQLDPMVRYRIQGDKTILAREGRMVLFERGSSPSVQATSSFGIIPVLDSNHFHYFWLENGQLWRSGDWAPSRVGDILEGATLFWVGPTFGFGFYRAEGLTVGFVFDEGKGILNDSVNLPAIKGQLVDATTVFSSEVAWFFYASKLGEVISHHCVAVNKNGEVLATLTAQRDDGTWLGGPLRGKGATGKLLFAPTDAGVIRVEIVSNRPEITAEFPDTEAFVEADSLLFTAPDGLYVVNGKEVMHLKLT